MFLVLTFTHVKDRILSSVLPMCFDALLLTIRYIPYR